MTVLDDSRTPSEALEQLVVLIELQVPGMRASILLLDHDGVTMRHGAAPHLPPEYWRAIDGARIGPAAGSCGTAVFRREQVIVADIANDPLWADYRSLAMSHGLRASWSTPIFDTTGAVLGSFAMYYSEPKVPTAAELTFTRTATLLAASIIVRARAEAAAERANRSKADFLATISHELRTPLNAIGGYATLMLDGIPDPATSNQQDYLRRILKGQQHILSLIESVLTHAKLEAGSTVYRTTNVRVSELLDVIDGLLTPQFAADGLVYDCADCDGALILRGDSEKTVQILLNLLSNAIKFTPRYGRISLRTAVPSPDRAVISVRDTGVGMTDEQVATVFEPFVQFENRLTARAKGTGLGMPISRAFARGMGGDLTVESTPGVGTEFALTMPIAAGT